MKIECVKEKVQEALGKVERLTGKNLSLPILSCVLLSAKKGTLVIRATNLEMGVEYRIPARVEQEGSVAITAGILSSFLGNLGSVKSIVIETDKTQLHITTLKINTSFKIISGDDFPTIPTTEGKEVSLPAKDFTFGLKSVSFSSSSGNLKAELGSVYIYTKEHSLIFAATDSFRLAEKKIPLRKPLELPPLLIPLKNVNECIRLLEGDGGEITLIAEKNQVSLKGNDFYATSRLISGAFPDYTQIIPKESTTEAIILKEDLQNALKLSTLFSDTFSQIHLSVKPATKTFEISAQNSAVGKSLSRIDAAISGEEVEANFNHRYISDSLQSITSDSLGFYLNGPGKPLVIKGVGDKSFTYLVMPMNR